MKPAKGSVRWLTAHGGRRLRALKIKWTAAISGLGKSECVVWMPHARFNVGDVVEP